MTDTTQRILRGTPRRSAGLRVVLQALRDGARSPSVKALYTEALGWGEVTPEAVRGVAGELNQLQNAGDASQGELDHLLAVVERLPMEDGQDETS